MPIKYLIIAVSIILFTNFSFSQNIKYEWKKNWGGESPSTSNCIDKDSDGNIYIGGSFAGTLEIETNSFTAQNHRDGFLMKLTDDGEFLWFKQFAGESEVSISSLVISDEEVFLLGGYSEQVVFDTTIISNNAKPEEVTNMFIASYSTSGDFKWARNTAGINHTGNTITLDKESNLIITGISLDVNVFDTEEEIYPIDSIYVYWDSEDYYWHFLQRQTGFLAKYDRAGNLFWVKQTGGKPWDVKVDENNNIVVIGSIAEPNWQDIDNDSIFYTGNLIEPTGSVSVFIAKHTSEGSLDWVDIAGGTDNNNTGFAIETDQENNIYATGYASGNNIRFQGIEYADYGRTAFVAKYDTEGLISWVKAIIGEQKDNHDRGFNSGKDIKLDEDNNLIIVGYYRDSLSFAGSIIDSKDEIVLMLLKMDTNGNELEAGLDLIGKINYANGMVLGDNREIYLTGKVSLDVSLYKIDADDLTSITPIHANLDKIETLPNPAKKGQLIRLVSSPTDEFKITIYSIDGQIVKNIPKNQDSFSLNNSGMYIVKLSSKNQSTSTLVIISD